MMNIAKSKLFLMIIVPLVLLLQANANTIVPQLLEMQIKKGRFSIPAEISYHFEGNCAWETGYFNKILGEKFSVKTKSIDTRKKANVFVEVDSNRFSAAGKEGYTVEVSKKGIHISAAHPAGVFYAIQSILQLIQKDGHGYFFLPLVKIFDKPRFSWRAFLLDEARSFKGAAVVKKMLDEMAFLKMNVFHWHLTDDQGWRIEIPQYPRLTSESSGSVTAVPGKTYYTQEEIRDIIHYASQRHILIVPEIEMPGHASAAIAAYPHLGVAKKQIVMPSKQGIYHNVYDVADSSVLNFIHDVTNEVMNLFPSRIMHVGGDEVKYDPWENSIHVQAFMKQNNIASPAMLQQWFVNGMSYYLRNRGWRMMGWNDMLGKSDSVLKNPHSVNALSPGTILHFWLGAPALINIAAAAGYDVVNSFHEYTYLDYNYSSISLKKAYDFEPVPASLDTALHDKILGLGCQMWGEHIPTVEKMYYQVFPRIAAYAETGWTAQHKKDFPAFKNALQKIILHWKESGIRVDPALLSGE